MFGRGTHYSVFRAVSWHDSSLNPLPNGEFLDFAIIWEEDHDTRVMTVVETMYFDGLLAPVRFVGERKGGLIVLVAPEKEAAWDLLSYKERVESAVRRSNLDDWWNVTVAYFGTESSIIGAPPEKVAVYLKNIDNLWNLGTKPRSRPDRAVTTSEIAVFEDGEPPDLCRRLSPDEVSSSCRRWRGDDEKGAYKHHGAIPLGESPVDIELRWRETENSPTKVVGCYRLDLNALLAHGYIRSDPKPGHVRLQFIHQANDIYIQHRAERRLRVGSFELPSRHLYIIS
jgi:hypothetical protein